MAGGRRPQGCQQQTIHDVWHRGLLYKIEQQLGLRGNILQFVAATSKPTAISRYVSALHYQVYISCETVRQKAVLLVRSFLPRDAMHKRGLCRHAVSVRASVRPSVCLSLRLSVTFVDHVKTNKHIFEIISPSGSHTILVYLYQTGWRYSDGNPPNWGVKCRWGRQKSRFRANNVM